MPQKHSLEDARILIVDDQESNVRLLEYLLASAEFLNLHSTTDPRRVIAMCQELSPDLILLDLHMPQMDGASVIRLISATFPNEVYLPVLVLTADMTVEAKQRALTAGAKDFLSKPFDTVEVVLRVRNLLETRALYKEIARQNEVLELRVAERTRQLAEAQVEILQRLALAAEYRDDGTGQHTHRVGLLCAMLAKTAGQSDEFIELIRLASPLHDVGKIGIPDRIFLKPGALTPAEFKIMQSHTTIGAEILGKSRFPVLRLAREIALAHHERWDGLGYPQKISGEMIPLAARITALADVFDALTHARPYKEAWTLDRAMSTIRKEKGRQFDPNLTEAFIDMLNTEGLKRLSEGVNGYEPLGSAVIESLR